MSAFSALMLRFGWIKLSRYGLEVGTDGQVHPVSYSSGGSSLDPVVDSFVVETVAQPAAVPPSLPPHTLTAEEEEQNAWQTSMAKAKLQSYTELGLLSVPEQEQEQEQEPEAEEDWGALIAAANARASQQEQEAKPEPELTSSTNEDGSSTIETPVIEVDATPLSEEEEWAALRREADAKQQEETKRMERGAREVQRLRRQSSTAASPPPHLRASKSTKNRKPLSSPEPVRAETTEELTNVEPSPAEVDANNVGDSTQVDVPRIGQG